MVEISLLLNWIAYLSCHAFIYHLKKHVSWNHFWSNGLLWDLFQLSFLLRNQDPKGQLEHRESDKLGEKFVASAKVWLAPSSSRFKWSVCSIGRGINADMGVVSLIEMLYSLSHMHAWLCSLWRCMATGWLQEICQLPNRCLPSVSNHAILGFLEVSLLSLSLGPYCLFGVLLRTCANRGATCVCSWVL